MAYLFRFLRRSATPRYSVLSGRKPGTSLLKMAEHGLLRGGQQIVSADALEFPTSKGKVIRQWLVVQIRFVIGP